MTTWMNLSHLMEIICGVRETRLLLCSNLLYQIKGGM